MMSHFDSISRYPQANFRISSSALRWLPPGRDHVTTPEGILGAPSTSHIELDSVSEYKTCDYIMNEGTADQANKALEASINKTRPWFMRAIKPIAETPPRALAITKEQIASARQSFIHQIPYLAPENIIPEGTTVESLLSEILDRPGFVYVHLGKVCFSRKDRPWFEQLQRELASIDESRAVRQLYQLKNGSASTLLIFSDFAISAALPHFVVGQSLVNVNPSFGALDIKSGTLIPQCVVLAHEIEHINTPFAFLNHLSSHKNNLFSNAEEFRVIKGVENGYLNAMPRGERTSHACYLVPMLRNGSNAVVFPYTINQEQFYLHAGEKLHGKIIAADRNAIILQDQNGQHKALDTKLLMTTVIEAWQPWLHSIIRPESKLQQKLAYMRAKKRAAEEERLAFSSLRVQNDESSSNEPDYSQNPNLSEPFKSLCIDNKLMQESQLARRQLFLWKQAAEHRDEMTLSISPNGYINLHRINFTSSVKENIA